jgi:hypothetical protein
MGQIKGFRKCERKRLKIKMTFFITRKRPSDYRFFVGWEGGLR